MSAQTAYVVSYTSSTLHRCALPLGLQIVIVR